MRRRRTRRARKTETVQFPQLHRSVIRCSFSLSGRLGAMCYPTFTSRVPGTERQQTSRGSSEMYGAASGPQRARERLAGPSRLSARDGVNLAGRVIAVIELRRTQMPPDSLRPHYLPRPSTRAGLTGTGRRRRTRGARQWRQHVVSTKFQFVRRLRQPLTPTEAQAAAATAAKGCGNRLSTVD